MASVFGRARCAAALFVCAWCATPHAATPHLALPVVSRHRPEVKEEHRTHWGRDGAAAARRRLGRETLLGTSADSTPLSGTLNEATLYPGTGTHYVNIFVGTPQANCQGADCAPQRVSVIVDTGSHYTAFPCAGCTTCGTSHTDLPFDPAKSSTCEYPVACSAAGGCQSYCGAGGVCQMAQSYTEGSSWSAKEARDLVWMSQHFDNAVGASPPHQVLSTQRRFATQLSFGCQYHETNLFVTQISNGIMGFAHHDTATIVPRMHRAGKIASRSFSMCFSPRRHGILVLGGVDARHHMAQMKYVSYWSQSSNWYTVPVRGVRLAWTKHRHTASGGGKAAYETVIDDARSAGFPSMSASLLPNFSSGKGTIVDSGTTDSYLPRGVAADFKRMMEEARQKVRQAHGADCLPGGYRTGYEYHIPLDCVFHMRGHKPHGAWLPPIVYVLDTVLVRQLPNAYLEFLGYVTGDRTKGKFKARVYLDEWSGAVLGANVMRGHDVHFDQQNKRLGWAESNCNSTSLAEMELHPAAASTAAPPTAAPTATPTATPTPSPTPSPTPRPSPPTTAPTPSPTPSPRECGQPVDSATPRPGCSAGSYCNTSTVPDMCTPCPLGHFSPTSSTYAGEDNSTVTRCTPCAADTFGADFALTACKACGEGSYTNGRTGQSACVVRPTPAPSPAPTPAPSPAPTAAPTPTPAAAAGLGTPTSPQTQVQAIDDGMSVYLVDDDDDAAAGSLSVAGGSSTGKMSSVKTFVVMLTGLFGVGAVCVAIAALVRRRQSLGAASTHPAASVVQRSLAASSVAAAQSAEAHAHLERSVAASAPVALDIDTVTPVLDELEGGGRSHGGGGIDDDDDDPFADHVDPGDI